MYYLWKDSKLVKTGATNLGGFIGSNTIEESKYTPVLETDKESVPYVQVFKKASDEFLVLVDFSCEDKSWNIAIKADSFQSFLDVLTNLKPLTDIANMSAISEEEDFQ